MKLQNESLFQTQAYINGAWTSADTKATFAVINPATGEAIAHVARLGAAETRRAINAAQAAQQVWRRQTAKARAAVLRRWADLVLANQDDLALLMTSEQGKPLAEARAEIASTAAFLEWFGEEARRVYGDVIPGHQSDKRIIVVKEPIGVCAGITPWNFPSSMISRKVGPAIAVGCAMVLKPAEQTPLSALALCVLAEEAGLPPGVLNVVTSDADGAIAVGGELTANPIVRKLSFTGSTEVGKLLMAQCAGTVKKLSLELGGNAPFIVFDDAELDAAVDAAIQSKFRNAGQTCICANRILVQDSVYDAFTDRFAAAVQQLKVGVGTDRGVQIGPLIDQPALDKMERHIADATAQGAQLVIGGKRHARGGTFFQPTLITGVTTDMQMCNEEIFGPVAGIQRFQTETDAIEMANNTPFGLAAYFYSRDMSRVWRVAEGLEYGMVGINTGLLATEVAPFGGVKESGIGREGSKYGMDDWLEMKYLCMGGIA